MSKEKPNMKLRMPGKDYTDPGYYFCTLVVNGRRHLLGTVHEVGEMLTSGKQTLISGDGEKMNKDVCCDASALPLQNAPYGHSQPYMGAYVAYTPYGQRVVRKIERIPFDGGYSSGKIIIKGKAVLPDHVHLLIYIAESIDKPLGNILNGFNVGCRHEWKTMCFECLPKTERAKRLSTERNDPKYMKPSEIMLDGCWITPEGQTAVPLAMQDGSLKIWEDGYNDQVVYRRNQLNGYYEYMRRNAWRLMLKEKYPQLFTKVWGKELLPGRRMNMVGNMFLLDRPWRVVVRISRFATVKRDALNPKHNEEINTHYMPGDAYGKTEYIYPKRIKTEEEIEEAVKPFIELGRKGAVLVTPCISPAEIAVVKTAYAEKVPVMMFCPHGFSRGYHPSDFHYEACSQGLLLQIAPYSFDPNRKFTKDLCEELNNLASIFSNNNNKSV